MEPIDHSALAVAGLPSHLQRPRLQGLARALVAPLAALEATLQILQYRYDLTRPETTGPLLDRIGGVLRFPRNGVDDATYKRYLSGLLVAMRSKGTAEELIAICVLVLNDGIPVRTAVEANATFHVYLVDRQTTQSVIDVLLFLLKKAASAGVRVLIDYTLSVPSSTFTLDVGPGLDVGHLAGTAS